MRDIGSLQIEGMVYCSPKKKGEKIKVPPRNQEELSGPRMERVTRNVRDEAKEEDCECLDVFVEQNKIIVYTNVQLLNGGQLKAW